jgi:HAE1 family hydrophobic/amphiphilic exporter-1
VVKTICEAVLLVVVVVILFLQTWRASIVPIVAIPVSLIGTFAMLAAMGFSLNNLSLFGLVLADRHRRRRRHRRGRERRAQPARGHEPARGGAPHHGRGRRRAGRDRPGAGAVFIPAAFIPGISGQFFRQFAITIATRRPVSPASCR